MSFLPCQLSFPRKRESINDNVNGFPIKLGMTHGVGMTSEKYAIDPNEICNPVFLSFLSLL